MHQAKGKWWTLETRLISQILILAITQFRNANLYGVRSYGDVNQGNILMPLSQSLKGTCTLFNYWERS